VDAYVLEWLNLLVRWLHAIAGIAWIGASLYFVWLDNHLVAPRDAGDAARGVAGEVWSVHGGGFYRAQKYPLGPRGEPLAQALHWFKWEAYTTWLSGLALLAIVYWWGAGAYLIDPAVRELSVPVAIAISAGSLVAGWIVYDVAARLIRHEALLAALVYAFVVAAGWGYGAVFGARAAYLHAGALIGTIMVWNVMIHIIPGQKKMVAAVRAGREPDPRPGVIGRQRSVHNTYFTLPVIFLMLSPHYPMTYAHEHAWAVLAAIVLAGALIREYFVRRHRGANTVALPAAAVALLAATAIGIAPPSVAPGANAGDASFARVQAVLLERCTVCHAEQPSFAGFAQPPGGVMLDTPDRIRSAAPRIHQQVVATRAMPIGNITKMTDEERALIAAWIERGARTDR